MRRREFIGGVGAAAVVGPNVLVWAEGSSVPTIGFLDYAGPREASQRVAAFRQGLAEEGLVEPQSVKIEFRWAENQRARLSDLAMDLVKRQVAVIVTQNATTPAAMAATSTIPIVFVSGGDPLVAGLVKSLSRPEGNVTGVSYTTAPLNGKRMELLRELVPGLKLIAVLHDPHGPQAQHELIDFQEAARALGLQMVVIDVPSEADFDTAFAKIVASGAGGLLVGAGAFFLSKRRELVARVARVSIPAIYILRSIVEAGGLMSYGANDLEAYRRAGVYVGQIFKGKKPGDLPVEMPRSYQLVINIAAAKALGLTVPPTLLARADEVIE